MRNKKLSTILLSLILLTLTACGELPTPAPAARPVAPTSKPASNITIEPPTTQPASPTTAPNLPTVTPAFPASTSATRTGPTTGATPAINLQYDPAAIQQALRGLPGQASALVLLPDGKEVASEADKPVPSASTIKLWVAATVLEQAKLGQLDLTQKHVVKQSEIASGTGILGGKVGQSYTLSALITTMLVYSDNSATNILVDQLGGFAKVNAYAQANGYNQTKIQRRLGFLDPNKDNYTSARDAATFMQQLLGHQIVDATSSDLILQALQTRLSYAQDQNFFGPKLGKTTTYRHISGTGTGVRNEVGVIWLNGQSNGQPSGQPDGPTLIIAIYTSNVGSETAAERAIASAVGQIYHSLN